VRVDQVNVLENRSSAVAISFDALTAASSITPPLAVVEPPESSAHRWFR